MRMLKIDKLDKKTVERIFSKIEIDEKTGCWNWIGNKNGQGYGRVRFNGPKVLVHRIMYAWSHGPIPNPNVGSRDIPIIDHICENKACVNPYHLRLVSHRFNMSRGNSVSSINARKTHCKNGHLLPTKKNKFGRRPCKICNAAYAREKYRRIHNLPPEKFKV